MTPPVRPEVDPLEALKALKRQANPAENDPLAQLKALRPQKHDYHAEYQSGALSTRMAAANARDAANLADEQGSEPVGPVAAFGHALAATGANIAQGIPGMEAVEAGARALVRGQPYREALGDIRSQTGKIPSKLGIGERVAGALPLTRFLPGSPVAGGAILGAAEGALGADPQSLGSRAGRTVIGAGTGAILGKAGETLVSGGRTLLAKGAARNLVERNAARAASAKEMYGKALAEGQGKEATDAIKDFLHETGIEEIVDELKQTRPFQTVAHDGPEMLDAVYKVLSDRSASLKRGLDAVTPNRPNIGRFRLQDTKAAQQRLLQAMETPGTATEQAAASEAAPRPPIGARTEGGRLRSFAKTSDEDLAAEYASLVDANAVENTAPSSREANGGAYQWVGQKLGAMRAEGRIAQRNKSIAKVEQELQRRGIKPEDAYWLGKPGDAGEAALSHGENATGDTSFDFGANVRKNVPAVMPSYRTAVEDYAKRSGDIEGVQRGYEALRLGLKNNLPTAKNLLRKSPEALQEWASTATESQRRAAGEGVLGGVRAAYGAKPVKSFLADALLHGPASKAGSVLRDAADPTQAFADQIVRALLLSGAASHR